MGTQRVAHVFVFVGAITLAACGGLSGSGGPTGPTAVAATVTSITVTTPDVLQVNGTAQMKAEAGYSDGSKKDVTATATWTSLSTDLATIVPGGTATGLAYGRVTIQASYQGVSGTLAVQVRGQKVNFTVTAIALDCTGSCEDFTQGGGDFSYKILATATVGDSQTVTPRVLSQTASYPNGDHTIELGKGQSRTLQTGTTFLIRTEAGAYVDLEFRATEWDAILFQNVEDPRMRDLHVTKRYTWSAANGWGDAFGVHTLVLGSGSCEIQLRYLIEFATTP